MRLTRGRLTLLRALEVCAAEEPEPSLRNILTDMHRRMRDGAILSEAAAALPEEFSVAIVELLKAAEKTGAWDEILVEMAEGLEEGTFERGKR